MALAFPLECSQSDKNIAIHPFFRSSSGKKTPSLTTSNGTANSGELCSFQVPRPASTTTQSSRHEHKPIQPEREVKLEKREADGDSCTEGTTGGGTHLQSTNDDAVSIHLLRPNIQCQTVSQPEQTLPAVGDRGHPKRRKLSPPDSPIHPQEANPPSVQHESSNASFTSKSMRIASTPIDAGIGTASMTSPYPGFSEELTTSQALIEVSETTEGQTTDIEHDACAGDHRLGESEYTDGKSSGPEDNTPSAMTPPKKMMKLRKDGRLFSPKGLKEAPVKSKKGRPSKNTPVPDSKIVTIPYRRSQNYAAGVGRQIDSILSGALNFIRKPSKPLKKPSNPAKSIHPFFLGPAAATAPVETQQSQPRHTSIDSQKDQDIYRSDALKVTPPNVSSLAKRTTSRSTKGALPPWPSPSTLHCRNLEEHLRDLTDATQTLVLSKSVGKSKAARINLDPAEKILTQYLPNTPERRLQLETKSHYKPVRRILSSKEARDTITEKLTRESSNTPRVPAVRQRLNELRAYTSAFDRFECEDRDWITKYAPKCAADVLQPESHMDLLKEWLFNLTVNTVEGTSSHKEAPKPVRKKKRRKVAGLDDFIVDADADEDDETSDSSSDQETSTQRWTNNAQYYGNTSGHRGCRAVRKLSPRNLRSTRAVIINGPNGSGKTASVYAIAEEVGFEIFEINSGGRRSGKDVLDKVGDMTRNHLVNRRVGSEEKVEVEDDSTHIQKEIESGRQSAIQSFFKPKPDKLASGSKPRKQKRPLVPEKPAEKAMKQRQSLILLEDVDVLFEEDKNFWGTVVSLLESSRRAIVMTCTDDSLLPYNELSACSMLRLFPPPADTAIDYLLSIAALEGHVLSREAVVSLYSASHRDFRRTLQQLQFWCQMALNDPKGGLDWVLLKSDVQPDQGLVRVMSEGTYQPNLGLLNLDEKNRPVASIDHDIDLLREAMEEWSFDTEDWMEWFQDPQTCLPIFECHRSNYEQLSTMDTFFEAISAGDIMPGSRAFESSLLDPTQDEITEKAKSNYTCGHPLLQADPIQDQTSTTQACVFALKLSARHLLSASRTPLNRDDLCEKILQRKPNLRTRQTFLRHTLTTALNPLAPYHSDYADSKPNSIIASESRLNVLTTDIAPCVRFIVSCDIRLEQERLRLSNLMSEGGQTVAKRQRKTRAAMAALEGGSKASTRRERWFEVEVNFGLVLRTGGEGWQVKNVGEG